MVLSIAAVLLAGLSNAGEAYCPAPGPVIGKTPSDSSVQDFDDCIHEGYNGAISQVCVKQGAKIAAVDVFYADKRVQHGDTENTATESCFNLLGGEFITGLKVNSKDANGIDSGITGIQFFTSQQRQSYEYGDLAGATTWTAPPNQHLMALYGNGAGRRREAGRGMKKLGVYWGKGGGTASWTLLNACIGCPTRQIKYTKCTSSQGSTSTKKTVAWSTSVQDEVKESLGFESETLKLTQELSGKIVSTETSSFKDQTCLEEDFACDKNYLWQLGINTNFDQQGDALTTTSYLVCTDQDKPCCAPYTFKSDPANCDEAPSEKNTCDHVYQEHNATHQLV